MAVIKIPTAAPLVKKDIVHAKKEYASPVIDTRVTNYNTLSTFASGSKWACDFYLNVLERDTAPQAYDADMSSIYGQFRLIRGFELLVTSPITPQQDDQGGRGFSVTGSANVYSAITPNEGSLFIAGLGDGRNGLFTVTKVARDTVYTESFTTIDFKQIRLLDKVTLDSLNSKVVETLYFDRELMRNGIAPLIKQKDVNSNQRLLKAYRRLTNLYVHEFYSTKYKTFVVPRQLMDTYDPFITRFALRVLDPTVCSALGDVIELTANQQPYARFKTLLDAVETVDIDLLYSVADKVCIANMNSYRLHPYFMAISTSGIKAVVATYNGGYMYDADQKGINAVGELLDAGFKKEDVSSILGNLDTTVGIDERTLIHPVLKDDHYIFSEAFYKDTPGQSELENLVRLRLSHKPFDLDQLADIADAADKFPNLERFYYIPIILAMIKISPGVL